MEQNPTTENTRNKRPLWQWMIIYLIPVLLVYGLVSYGIPSMKGVSPTLPARIASDHTVTYTDAGFSPNILAAKKGSTIVFKNGSATSMRVASNPHPIHDAYPTSGGCISSTFDSCANIPPGGSWSFTFDIAGTWGYHNHLNSTDTGTIVVQ